MRALISAVRRKDVSSATQIPMSRFQRSTRYHHLGSEPAETSSSGTGHPYARRAEGDDDDLDASQDFSVQSPYLDQDRDHVTAPLLDGGADNPLPLGLPGAEQRFWFQRSKDARNLDAIATQPSVFDDPETLKEYRPGPEWENTHRFDPDERWTWGEEYRLVRKIDLRIMVFVAIMFMALELDRSNISQALTDNILDDLGMTTNDYNLGQTLFRLAFLCAELPSQLVAKWLGPDVWIPTQMVVWSIVGSVQYYLKGRTSYLLCRALLGLLQGGFIPEIILYLSYFYKHHELSLRLGFFWTASAMADVMGGFLAFGILHLRGVTGQAGWRWLFLIEGVLTGIIGVLAFVLMPSSPTSSASWFRGSQGWFTEREEKIMVNRVLREDPSKSSMHNREPLTPALLWRGIKDFDLWPIYILGLFFQIPMSTPSNYLTLTLKAMGFGTFGTNLLVIPSKVFHVITMLCLTYATEVFGELTLTSMIGQIWTLPFLIFMNVVNINSINKWLAWVFMTAFLSYPNAHAIQVSWTSRNSNHVRSRTVSAAMYNMSVQTSSIIAANIYRADDAPLYKRGNKVLLCISFLNLGLYLGTKVYYVKRNRDRDRKWTAMNEREKMDYLLSTEEKGNKRLDFRFAC